MPGDSGSPLRIGRNDRDVFWHDKAFFLNGRVFFLNNKAFLNDWAGFPARLPAPYSAQISALTGGRWALISCQWSPPFSEIQRLPVVEAMARRWPLASATRAWR